MASLVITGTGQSSHVPDTPLSLCPPTHHCHCAHRHTTVTVPTDTPLSLCPPTHHCHCAHRHTTVTVPTDTPLSLCPPTHHCHCAHRHTTVTVPTDTPLSLCPPTHHCHCAHRHTTVTVPTDHLAKWLRRPPPERKTRGSLPASFRDFSPGSSHTSDLKTDTPGVTLVGVWRYKVTAGTGWSGVSIPWLGEVESLICNFSLSVAARTIV